MVKDQKYGLPSIKKYPMPDPKHVKSAIKFFNYVDKKNEQELADAILSRIKEYDINIENLNIGDDNRFKKYILKTELMHHGIKGMHWGIRRFQNPDGSLTEAGKKRYDGLLNDHMKDHTIFKARNGDTIELQRVYPSAVARGISKFNPNMKKEIAKNSNFKVTVNGKTVGDMQLYQKDKKELNGVWIGIDKKHRGHGYANAIMKNVLDYAKEAGNDKFTLEVPGNSPDARHIYEKYGAVAVKKISSDKDVWGGLTAMEIKLHPSTSSGKDACNKILKSNSKNNLNDLFEKAKEKHPELTYDKIYKDMKVDMSSEDSSIYKEAEAEWFKRHGIN